MPEFNSFSELISWIGTAADINDQKLVQENLLQAKKLADAASDTKSRFLANMSHEIRTPLGAILGFSELLVDPTASVKEKDEAISSIRRNGDQLSKIIDEILDLSKIEAGKIRVDLEEVSVVDFLNGVKGQISIAAKEKGLHLSFDNQGRIPSHILSNSTRLQQILINIIGNAIKFSPQGEIKVVTSLVPQTRTKPSLLSISVQDTGPGLTAAQIKALFQPFTQVDTSMTRKHGGTGLGLALSRKLARALGGDIKVSPSLPGEGCKFVITIETGPLDRRIFVNTLDRTSEKAPTVVNDSGSLKGIRILLVEDSLDNQVLISRFLSMAGALVDLANNGVEGVKKAQAGEHDVVLMDIQMPELDGYGAISQLKKLGFLKPIIALTAHGMIEERQLCLSSGFSDHLTKPINRTTLIDRIRQLSERAM